MAETAIDIQAAQGAGPGWNVGEYVTSLTAALLDAASPGDRVALITSPFEAVPERLLAAAQRSAASVAWTALPLPSPASSADDRVVSAAYDALPLGGFDYLGLGPLEVLRSGSTCGPPDAPRWSRRVLLLIHDLTPVLLPEQYLEAFSGYERRYRRRLAFCAGADALCTATGYLAAQVPYCVGRTRAMPQAIGLAAPEPGAGPGDVAGEEGADVSGAAVVYAYEPAPQRRPDLLIEAAAALPRASSDRLRLIYLTAAAESARLREVADRLGLRAGLVKVVPTASPGPGARAGLSAALRGALAYAMPSCSEGYDLAALEAPRLGTPVLAPDQPNGAGAPSWDAGRFDPTDAASLAAQLERLLCEDGYREKLLGEQVGPAGEGSWPAVAGRVRSLLEADSDRAPAARGVGSARPPRVAVTGPLPPLPSGISKYIEDQTRAVAGRVEVDWVRSPDSPGPAAGEGPPVLDPHDVPAGRLWWHHMANQRRFHFHQFELIAARRGVVELHDVALPFVIPPVLVPPAGVRVPGDLREELESVYREAGASSYLESEDAGVGVLLRWLARSSDAVVVHSGQAAAMVRRHVGDPDLRLFVVPLGIWMSSESRLVALSSRVELPERPYVVVPGFVGPAKWPEGIIAAIGRVPAERRPLLVFAGMCPPHLEAKLHHEARQREVDLVITGFLSSDAFDAWLARAAAAVIGRLVIRGETSATLQRATRMGTPTIVAASGAFSELPGGVPLLSVVELAPSAVAARVSEVLASPLRSPWSAERKAVFDASLEGLRSAFSWEPTVALMEGLAGGALGS